MRKDFKARYRLIIERLKMSSATYQEIRDFLLKSNEFRRLEIETYSIRTLQRDIRDIESIYDVVIHNKRKDPRYYLVEDPYK